MTRYVRRTVTFLLPEHQSLLDQLNKITQQQYGKTTDAIRFLIDYYANVAPIAGSTIGVARLLNELRHDGIIALPELLNALEQESPGIGETLKELERQIDFS